MRLRKKIYTSFLASTLFVFAIFLGFWVAFRVHSLNMEYEQQKRKLMQLTTMNIQLPLWHLNEEAIKAVMDALFENREVISIELKNENSRLLYFKKRKTTHETQLYSQDLYYNSLKIGKILVVFSDEVYIQKFWKETASIILFLFTLFSFYSLIVYRFSSKALTPIHKLSCIVQQFSATNKMEKIPADLLSHESEIGTLSIAIQKMYDSLNDALKTVQQKTIDQVEIIQSLKQTTTILEEKERHFRELYHAIPIGYQSLDKEGRLISINDSWSIITGFKKEEVLGSQLFRYLEGEDKLKFKKSLQKLIATGKSKDRVYRFRTKHEGVKFVSIQGRAIHNIDGKFEKTHCIFQDVHAQVSATNERLESEKNLRAVFNALQESAVLINMEDDILFANKKMEDFFPILKTNKKMNLSSILDENDLFYTAKEKVISEKTAVKYDDFTGSKSLIKTIYPIFNKDNEINRLAVLSVNISARKDYEDKIKKMNEKLEELVQKRTIQLSDKNQDLEAFSYSISHDLKAPLRHIKGFFELLKKQCKNNLPEQQKKIIHHIELSIEKMSAMIDDLLEFARFNKAEICFSSFLLSDLLENIMEEIKSNYSLKINFENNTETMIYGDLRLLEHAFTNLLSNAVKYASKQDEIEIKAAIEQKEDAFLISIQDNGCGFNMDYAENLFKVFHRLHGENEFEGNGIGLAITKRIIERHNGKIWGISEENKGATFFITLPRHNDKI